MLPLSHDIGRLLARSDNKAISWLENEQRSSSKIAEAEDILKLNTNFIPKWFE